MNYIHSPAELSKIKANFKTVHFITVTTNGKRRYCLDFYWNSVLSATNTMTVVTLLRENRKRRENS